MFRYTLKRLVNAFVILAVIATATQASAKRARPCKLLTTTLAGSSKSVE
mgnify:CR=1 FL=1